MAEYKSKYSAAQIEAAVDNMQTPIPVSSGGTGATTAENALLSLGVTDKLKNYLPLTAGENKVITGNLCINNGSFSAVKLIRSMNGVNYNANVGIGSNNDGVDPSCALEVWNSDTVTKMNRLDLMESGLFLEKGFISSPDGYRMPNSKYIYGRDKNGIYRNILGINSSNNFVLGYDLLDVTGSSTLVYGNSVYLISADRVYFTPRNGDGGYISVQYSSSDSKNIMMPSTNGGAYNGASTYRWQGVYTVNAVNVSSDRRLKKDISYDFTKFDYLIDNLKPVHYKLINDDKEETHFGFIAQDFEDTLLESGHDIDKIAVLTKDTIDNDSDLEKILDDKISYGLGYTEIIALNTVGNQKNKEEIKKLKEELSRKDEEIDSLKNNVESLQKQINDILNKLNI